MVVIQTFYPVLERPFVPPKSILSLAHTFVKLIVEYSTHFRLFNCFFLQGANTHFYLTFPCHCHSSNLLHVSLVFHDKCYRKAKNWTLHAYMSASYMATTSFYVWYFDFWFIVDDTTSNASILGHLVMQLYIDLHLVPRNGILILFIEFPFLSYTISYIYPHGLIVDLLNFLRLLPW